MAKMPEQDSEQKRDAAKANQQRQLEAARGAIGRIFDLLGVKKVVVVDDELNQRGEVGDLIARCNRLLTENRKRLETVPELKSVSFDGNDDDRRQDLQQIWRTLDDQQQEDLLVKLDWIPGRVTFSALEDLLINYERIFLSLTEWRQREPELTTPEALTESLLIFDLDLSKEQGGAVDEGMRIIKALLGRYGNRCHCGLLSHLIAKDTEFEDWQRYVSEHELHDHQHRFVVISKKHLPSAPMVFAQRLKRAAISIPCDELRRSVEVVVSDAFAAAKKELARLNVYDFEQIVFQSAYAEGAWEPDTVLRICFLYCQREARRLMAQNPTVETNASRIRSVIDIGFRPSDAPAATSQQIKRLENFEDGAFLRKHHIPLELGDIFSTASGAGEFILLAQPCDLMCRNDDTGKRVSETLVAQIVEQPANNKTFDSAPAFWKLDAYSTDAKQAKYVSFHNVRAVPILALDMTVFDGAGRARFRADENCPANVIPAWRRRYDAIASEVSSILARFVAAVGNAEAHAPEAMQLITDALAESVPHFVTATLDSAQGVLTYDIERVARLKQPRAASLLRAFAAYVSRDGFEHDLTRTLVATR